jgi:hypothetical protein
MGIFDDEMIKKALSEANQVALKYNIDINNLTQEEQAAYQAAIDKAVAENRSLNVYGKEKFKEFPKRYAKSVEEQRNIMALGIPATTDLWGDLDPAFEISNRIPGGKLEDMFFLGETYGMFNPFMPERTKESPGIGLNLDKLGNEVIADMAKEGAPVEDYKKRFQQGAYGLFNHEREHTYLHNRSPFEHPIDVVKQYIRALPENEREKALYGIIGVRKNFKNLGQNLSEVYGKPESGSLGVDDTVGLFEEAAARAASEDGFNWIKDEDIKEQLKKYINWKRTGLFE